MTTSTEIEQDAPEIEALKAMICKCPECGGDGKETCNNPDHGFIAALSWTDVGRLGCPVCGHDPYHKVPKGGACEICSGTGLVTLGVAIEYCGDQFQEAIERNESPLYRTALMDAHEAITNPTPRPRKITGRSALRVQPEDTINPQREF